MLEQRDAASQKGQVERAMPRAEWGKDGLQRSGDPGQPQSKADVEPPLMPGC